MRRMLLNAGSVVLAASTVAAVTSFSASAQEDITISGNVGLFSDYRFRGISLSDEQIALQGGLDLTTSAGLYVGTWGSNIEPLFDSNGDSGELELDVYGGYRFSAAEFSFDVGALGYLYPGTEDLNYYEIYGIVGKTFGMVATSAGVRFSPEQDNLGDEDNIYYYATAGMPLGDSGFSLSGGLGYEDGVFGDLDGDGEEKIDWNLGVFRNVLGVDVGLTYFDTTEDVDGGEGTAVLSFKKIL